jgi:hypothetical protein
MQLRGRRKSERKEERKRERETRWKLKTIKIFKESGERERDTHTEGER